MDKFGTPPQHGPSFVGVLTGLRPGDYSVSVNYRRTEFGTNTILSEILTNIKRADAGH